MIIMVVITEAEVLETGKQMSDIRGIGNKTVLTLVSLHQSKLVL